MDLDVVDTQVHLFHKMSPEACLFAMDSLGIQAVLIDEMWEQVMPAPPFQRLPNGADRPLTDGARMASMRHPDRFKYLKRVNHQDPELATLIRFSAEDPHCLALRARVYPDWAADFATREYRPLFAEAAKGGIPVFVFTQGRNRELEPYLAEITDCQFILDHVGSVKTPEAWDEVLRLAKYPNLSLKWCHAHNAFGPFGDYPYRSLHTELKRAVDFFGRERVMWGSDATMLTPGVTWADALYYVRECELLSQEDRAWVLGRTARAKLRWPQA
jgi:predicted TIM-barrel fold metal-dependent hydrolase